MGDLGCRYRDVTKPLYVYVIASSPNRVKIGYSGDPEQRLIQLQVGSEKLLTLVHKEPVTPKWAPILEKRIHSANRHRCLHGESFNLTHEEAIGEIKFAVIRYEDEDLTRLHRTPT